MVIKQPKIYENELADFDVVLREAEEIYNAEPYALVGAYALILHGVRRFTEDIDLLRQLKDWDVYAMD